MKKSLLVSAAAILIAGTGASFALPSKESAPERVPAAQRPVPAEKITPPVTTGQVEPRTLPRDAQVPPGSSRALDEKPETTGQGMPRDATPDAAPGQASPAQRSPGRDVTPSSSDKSPRTGAQTSSPTTSQTTGQGAASTSSNLTTEQRTKISSSIKQQQVAPLTNVNFSITIGTAIPREIQRAPLPAAVLDVYPAWRGYEFIVVGNEILIIDPPTLRIVAILET